MPDGQTHREAVRLHKAKRSAARARRRARVADWSRRWLRCQGCGRWTATEGVAGYGGGRVFCGPCALALDARRWVLPLTRVAVLSGAA